jgi:hypothetical protein
MSTGREAQVPHVLEYGGVLPDRLVGHRAEQLLETVGSGEAAELAELHVAGYSELATPLHVQADQVHAEAGSGFFEQWFVTSWVMESSMACATWFINPMKYSSSTPARYKS